ncbi:DNA replication and repair protein RecF [Candidatus Dependentiae bacterium]|nr:DNA replication and repair protein RecF [Candidatus Dependentiae bacterium]
MFINELKLKNFRCFSDFKLNFEDKFVVLEGNNGSGKTTILEALYYACYLRSFRTRLNRELSSFKKDLFFLQVDFEEEFDLGHSSIQIGYSNKDGKLVKLNKKPVSSFKDIISRYKVISLTLDDMQLVVGAPEFRRAYLNQSMFLLDSKIIFLLKEYKKVLEQRNKFMLINSHSKISGYKKDELYSWTKQLWEKSNFLQNQRIEFLKKIEKRVNQFLNRYFCFSDNIISIELNYSKKNTSDDNYSYDKFWDYYQNHLLDKEQKWQRTLFGVHLDDFSINFKNKKARFFASRGQQKLILFLLKVVQLLEIQENESGVLLLDDFLTDFDVNKLVGSVSLLREQDFQFFITSPIKSFIKTRLKKNKKTIDFQTHFLA